MENWSRYESIFQHYQLTETPDDYRNQIEIKEKTNYFTDLFPNARVVREKNESKSKTINAKTVNNKSKKPKSQSPGRKKGGSSVINIPVPPAAQSRKTNYTGTKTKQTTMKKPPQNLPPFKSDSRQSISSASDTSSVQKSTASSQPSTPAEQKSIVVETPPPSPQRHGPEVFEPPWNLDEINEFIRKMFYTSPANAVARHTSKISSDRVKLRCDKEEQENVDDYIATHGRCIEGFEEYVEAIRRQHGIVRDPALDPPIFEPGITIMGSKLKKDPEQIDREDANVIKKLKSLEPRKKYALVHEDVGIFIIGGYLLDVKTPSQKEPTSDYVFRFNGQVTKIPTIKPCRIHFGIYTDGDAIYVAGGQTIQNGLLDDIQRLSLKDLKWEHVATLANPVAACGMTIYNNKIHIVGGYDILKNQTIVLPDYTIYNLLTEKFERSSDLPTPRCRSLIFATDGSIFCVSGLTETRDLNVTRKLMICRDILRWNEKEPEWKKVSETPPLTTDHALAFTDPYLEVLLRTYEEQADGSGEPKTQSYYHFPTNTWHPGKPPAKYEPHTPFLSPNPTPKTTSTPKKAPSKAMPKSSAGLSPKTKTKSSTSQSVSKGKTNKTNDKKNKKKK